jgi:hypothetical protein
MAFAHPWMHPEPGLDASRWASTAVARRIESLHVALRCAVGIMIEQGIFSPYFPRKRRRLKSRDQARGGSRDSTGQQSGLDPRYQVVRNTGTAQYSECSPGALYLTRPLSVFIFFFCLQVSVVNTLNDDAFDVPGETLGRVSAANASGLSYFGLVVLRSPIGTPYSGMTL